MSVIVFTDHGLSMALMEQPQPLGDNGIDWQGYQPEEITRYLRDWSTTIGVGAQRRQLLLVGTAHGYPTRTRYNSIIGAFTRADTLEGFVGHCWMLPLQEPAWYRPTLGRRLIFRVHE